jgi:hypothetical protein
MKLLQTISIAKQGYGELPTSSFTTGWLYGIREFIGNHSFFLASNGRKVAVAEQLRRCRGVDAKPGVQESRL